VTIRNTVAKVFLSLSLRQTREIKNQKFAYLCVGVEEHVRILTSIRRLVMKKGEEDGPVDEQKTALPQIVRTFKIARR